MKLVTSKKKTIPTFPGIPYCAQRMFLFCVLCCIFVQIQKCKVICKWISELGPLLCIFSAHSLIFHKIRLQYSDTVCIITVLQFSKASGRMGKQIGYQWEERTYYVKSGSITELSHLQKPSFPPYLRSGCWHTGA